MVKRNSYKGHRSNGPISKMTYTADGQKYGKGKYYKGKSGCIMCSVCLSRTKCIDCSPFKGNKSKKKVWSFGGRKIKNNVEKSISDAINCIPV